MPRRHLLVSDRARADIAKLGALDEQQAIRGIAHLRDRLSIGASIHATRVHGVTPPRWQVRLARGLRAILADAGDDWQLVQVFDKQASSRKTGLPVHVR